MLLPKGSKFTWKMWSLIALKLKVLYPSVYFYCGFDFNMKRGKVRANILEACETKCTRKSLQKEKANFIFYITLRDHYKFCKGRENRIMWLRKPKAFHSLACILEQSPFMYNDRFHRPDIIMSDIMREVLLISHCNHVFSQSLYQVYAFDYFNVQYIF